MLGPLFRRALRFVTMVDAPFQPVLSEQGARIVVEIRNSDAIDLLDFTDALSGLAREYEANLRRTRPGIALGETRLLIVDVRKGSVILEMVTGLAPFVSSAEIVNTSVDFVRNLKSFVSPLMTVGGRAENATTQRLKNVQDTVALIAKDPAGELDVYVRHQEGEILQEFRLQRTEARTVLENATAQRLALEAPKSDRHEKVLMTLHQSAVDPARVGQRTHDKGVIERIDPTPRPLIYASQAAGDRIKSVITAALENPYRFGFVVDVDIETVNGRPRAYRVTELHDVVDLAESE